MFRMWGAIIMVNSISLMLFGAAFHWGRWYAMFCGFLFGTGMNMILISLGIWKPAEKKVNEWLDRTNIESRLKFYWFVAKEFFKP